MSSSWKTDGCRDEALFAHDMTKKLKYSCVGQDGALLAGRGSALASFLYTL